jgi:hypothetical protein
MKAAIYRQGDVLLVPAEIPAAAQTKGNSKRIVLAEGEVTGHHHVLEGDKLEELLLPGDVAEMNQRFVNVVEEAELTHPEHATIAIPAGQYEVRQQVEFAPDEVRTVAD